VFAAIFAAGASAVLYSNLCIHVPVRRIDRIGLVVLREIEALAKEAATWRPFLDWATGEGMVMCALSFLGQP
jgi:hypothetical protein